MISAVIEMIGRIGYSDVIKELEQYSRENLNIDESADYRRIK